MSISKDYKVFTLEVPEKQDVKGGAARYTGRHGPDALRCGPAGSLEAEIVITLPRGSRYTEKFT
jgi:hypothetical protein